MNTDVKCSIIEASSNELLYQIEVHNGLIPAYIVKKHDGPIPYIHTCEIPQLGGKSENSIAWEAVTAGKSEKSQLGSLHGGEKVKIPWLREPLRGGESENS